MSEQKPIYKSKDGWETLPVIRGFHEIENLFYDLQKHRVMFCGGYIRYMCSPHQNPSNGADIDIYISNEPKYEEVVKFLKKERYLTVRHENDMAVTFQRPKDRGHPYYYTPPIQLIKPIKEGAVVARGTMEEILANFDFTVIRIGLKTRFEALADADFIHDEDKKILRLKNIHCPISSTLRCMKYAKKGYWLPPMQALKLFLDWENRDQDYRDKLRNYLVQANEGTGLTQKEIDELEALMRID